VNAAARLKAEGWRDAGLLVFRSNQTTVIHRSLGGARQPGPVFYRVVFEDADGQTLRMQGKQLAARIRSV